MPATSRPTGSCKRIIEYFLAFRHEMMPWTRISEQAYVNARRLPFEFKL